MHHQRRKSGNTSVTDLRKLTTSDSTKHKRPGMTRRHTPSNPHKLGRSHRERNEIWDNEEGESFPQYCMSCEKQFIPSDDMFLYCSDSCRRVDQNSSSQAPTVRGYTTAAYNHSIYSIDKREPRDIVPRASPSRPTSMHFSNSPPASPGTAFAPQHTSAISALRSLNARPPSPPSPTSSSGIWPFGRSIAASPSNSSYSSYTRPTTSGFFSSTYDYTHSHETDSTNMERPLPSRRPGGYSRPKSIELVTPMLSR
ncbi:hypothetical protein PT974_08427 [Cladobotryum mycophilum]|uniref:Life-span regulatory factor domain-containing protein n=1 Tax=Cladobotryum mycophilum TaxID=491253 RepID=A0ABR0SDE4_9HYPO